VITTVMSTVIGAGRARVWRALTAPDEVVRWDERTVALVDPPDGYPRVGERVRWRYRLGTVGVIRHERPLEVAPGLRLRCAIALGGLRFDETYTLTPEPVAPGQPDRTRVAIKLVSSNAVPVVSGLIDRFDVRRLAAELIDTRLRSLQQWCEKSP
jgi:uncharacterized protein YndB with AHSA1/START domain